MLNHYQTLNVSASADLTAIKKAYYKISLLHHPDKTVQLPAAERSQREHLFKLANVAFEVLSDPHKRKVYDQNLNVGQNGHRQQNSKPAQPPNCHKPPDVRPQNDYNPHPLRTPKPPPGGSQGPQDLQRAPHGSHRFSTTTLGTPPDFNWCHSEVLDRSERTTFTYSNWLGWRFSIELTNRFEVVAKPIIPEKPLSEIIFVRLPLQRKPKQVTCAPTDVVIDLGSTPGSKHTIFCSALIETTEGLELLVELVIASEAVQKNIQEPTSWKWTYDIDHEPLAPGFKVRVTNLMFYPLKPSVVSLNGGMPGTPYPGGSPMRNIVDKFPGISIEERAPNSYCQKQEQSGKTFWRLIAVGSKL